MKKLLVIAAAAALMIACTPEEKKSGEIKPSEISLDKTSLQMEISQTVTLVATISPSDVSNRSVDWASSNYNVASVDDDGLVTAVGAGEADITVSCTLYPEVNATCHITVEEDVVVTEISLSKSSIELEIKGKQLIEAQVGPADARDKTITWTSSNSAVATVTDAGLVEGLSGGEAIITASAGTATATCKVSVLDYTDTGLLIKVDGCNSPSGWCYGKNTENGGVPFDFTAADMDKEDFLTGCAALKVTPKHYRWFQKKFEEPVNVSSISSANACLLISLYVSDASLVPADANGQVEISSSGKADENELAWTFSQLKLKDGWNTVMLPFACAAATGTFDPSNLNFVRIYHTTADATGNLVVKLDQVRVVNCQIQSFDVLENWGANPGTAISLDNANMVEGKGCYNYSNDASATVLLISKEIWKFEGSWMTPVANKPGFVPTSGMVLQFKLYVDNPELFVNVIDGEIEFCTGDTCDVQETSWHWSKFSNVQKGWNTITLKLDEAGKSGCDWSNIRYFRFYRAYNNLTGMVTFKIDDMIIYPEGLCPRP